MNFKIPDLREEDEGLDWKQLFMKYYPEPWSLTKKQRGNPENFRAYLSRLFEKATQDKQYWIWNFPLGWFDFYDIIVKVKTKSGVLHIGSEDFPWLQVWKLIQLHKAELGPFDWIGKTNPRKAETK